MRNLKWNELFRRSTALLLALVMMLSMTPVKTLAGQSEKTEENPWSGRSAVFVGDSITAGTGTTKIYYEYLEETLGFGSVTAMGIGGSCISAASDYGQNNQPLISRYQDIPSADLIVIFMGTNDYGHETPIGSADDTQDGTFYGALNVIIPALVEKHPSSKIVFVTSLHRYGFGTSKILGTKFTYDHLPNGVGATLGDYVNAAESVCAANGVSVIDLHTECTLDPSDDAVRAEYMPDGIHPNAAGHEVIAGILEAHIREYKPVEEEPVVLPEMIQGNKFAAGNNQPCRASSRVNYYLKAGTVITLKDPEAMQWACARTSNEYSSNNLGYFPESQWTDIETAVVANDGWIGFTFKYRDETKSFDLTRPLSDYITIEEPHTHSYEKGVCTVCGAEDPAYVDFTGKTLSILGDSISTYSGVSNDSSANSTIGSNAVYYSTGSMNRDDTWWQQTIDALNMELLVNNSWSGSCILHTRSNTVGAYVDRCVQLHNDQTGEEPDVILVFMGTNDFSYYQSKLGTADIDYDALITENADGSFTYATPTTSCEAYAIMLHKMTRRYPDAEIYCMTMLARRDPIYSGADVGQPTAFNAELVKIIKRFGCIPVDMESCGITSEPANFDLYMGDKRVHPNAAGMDKMTEAVIHALTGENTEVFTLTAKLTNAVLTEEGSRVLLNGSSYRANIACEFGFADLQVTVTMGGVDITESCYADGVIEISNVTADIVVTAQALTRIPQNYRWEFDGSNLVSVGDTENSLTKLAGTTSEGVFTSTRYQMAGSVLLQHDLPWVVEWKGEGEGGFMLAASSNATAAPFFFRRAGNYLNAFGDYDGSQYNNYGIALDTTDIDGSAEHVYRLENRIASDGSNMVYLRVDGVEVSALNHYYVGGSAKGTTGNWISGENFAFSHIGTTSHPLTNYTLEYLQVWENGEPAETLALRYDDYYDITGKTVEIVDAGTPTSYKVGYGVAEGTLDDAVVTLDGNTLIATGIGTALVRIDGVLYEITVEAAPISLMLLIGQSNMEGMVGNANQSIACENGQVYATYAKANGLTGDAGLTVDNAGDYVPSALTGTYSTVNVNGTDNKLSGYPVNSLTEAGAGKYGMDSAIAYEWTRQTGEKVWIVNAAHGASSISSWQKGQSNFEEACALLSACQEVLQKEIAAGHYTFSHMGYYWCQGCADETKSAQWYVSQYLAMHENLKTELAFDADLDLSTEDTTFEFGGIVLVMAGHETATGYRKGTYSDSADSFFASFKELEMRGPRVAQIWMANNPELKDIHLVCTLAQDWVIMPDGTDGVEAYFADRYENGVVDYPTQVTQAASWYAPKTPAAVKNSIHYYQIGYNEVGREAARNTLYILGLLKKPEIETTVSFLDWTGYQSVDTLKTSSVGYSETLVVPMVYPCYESKTVTYSVTDGLQYLYYDLLDSGVDGGMLTASVGGQSVSVTGREYYSYRFELVDGEMISVSNDIFRENVLTRNSASTKTYALSDTVVLKHNKPWTVEFNSVEDARFMALASTKGATEGMFYFFKSKSGSGVLSIGEYKDGLYQNYGLKQQQIGIDWTAPHIYTFQNVINADGTNTIYIYIDNEWVGTATNLIINDALQSTDNMYLSGKDLTFSSVGCGGFALDSDQMTYLEVWENGKPDHIPGDINGDGDVNNKDLTRLFKYLTSYDVEVQEAALDVNGDGEVNNKDQTRLFKYLSGYPVEIY